jgi:hypothetical protein
MFGYRVNDLSIVHYVLHLGKSEFNFLVVPYIAMVIKITTDPHY